MRSWHPSYRVTTVSAAQVTSDLSLSDDWNVRGDCLPSPTAGQSQICGPRVLENQPWLASAHWLWWEVNIWAHWDWAPRRHKLWPGQPGNPPLCFIHNNGPTFVNLTLKLKFWQAESINLLYICWGIWGVRKTLGSWPPLRCDPRLVSGPYCHLCSPLQDLSALWLC